MAIFQYVSRHHLGILKFGFLTVKKGQENQHASRTHGAKFGDARSNHCLHMAIFQFFKIVVATILDF